MDFSRSPCLCLRGVASARASSPHSLDCVTSSRSPARRSASPPSRCSFILLSPLILPGEPVVWRALPIFAAIGLVFPALLTFLTFASNRALGPVATSTLGNLAPLFAVAHGGAGAA